MSSGDKNVRAIIAFDHRNYFDRLLVNSVISAEEHYATIVQIKDMIFTAVTDVAADINLDFKLALLVDEKYGSNVVLNAARQGLLVALSVERNEAREFTLEYGDNWKIHAEALHPDYIKVLIRWSLDEAGNIPTGTLLQEVFNWSKQTNRGLLLEIIPENNNTEILISAAHQILALGITPEFWKIPLPQSLEEAKNIVRAAQGNSSTLPAIFILGGARSGDEARRQIQPFLHIPGISGWAVGRGMWGAAAEKFIFGSISTEECTAMIADELQKFLKIL